MLSAIATPTPLLPVQAEPQAAGTDPAAASFLAALMAAMVGAQPAIPTPQVGEAASTGVAPAAGPATAVGLGTAAAAPAAPPFVAQSAPEPAQVPVPAVVPPAVSASPTTPPPVPLPTEAPAEAALTASASTPITALVAALSEQKVATPDLAIPELSTGNEQPPSGARPSTTAAPAPAPAVAHAPPTAKGADPSEVAPVLAESDDSSSMPPLSSAPSPTDAAGTVLDQGPQPAPADRAAGSAPIAHQATVATHDVGPPAASVAVAPPPALPRVTLPHLTTGIVAAVAQKQDRLTLQLDPAELGRVEVALRVDEGGKLHAAFAIERPDTLSLLQRDARGLEQMLAGSGLQLANSGLSFSPRREDGQSGGGSARASAQPEMTSPVRPIAVGGSNRRPSRGLLDLSV
jgi:flagellar hook-length control protein FliK